MAIYSKVSGIGAGLLKGIDGISINKVRSINASLSSAFALLLDERYGFGAEAAYSVRRLSGLYNGPLLVVRRDSDDATLEVGFTASNDLDVSAIETFCGTANGYVTEWRDQSGNLNHARQSAATSQPKIYDATTGVVTENGKPKILPNDAGDGFSSIAVDMSGSTISMFSVVSAEANNSIMVHFGGVLSERIFTATSGSSTADGSYAGLTGGTVYFDGVAQSSMKTRGEIYTQFYQNQTLGSYVGFSSLVGTSINLSGSANYWSMYGMQEIIFYDKDQAGNRTDIESNIGSYYGDNVELLDTYSGAAAAYSLRKLSSSYSGALVRVREDGTDTQADIYANVFGELDTIALAAHCGSNNGLVVGWYDQSGNLNDATQPSLTAQPKIYDGTTGVLTVNGKPIIDRVANYQALSTPLNSFGSNVSVFMATNSYPYRGTAFNGQNTASFALHAFPGSTNAASSSVGTPTYYVNGSTASISTADDVVTTYNGIQAVSSILSLDLSSWTSFTIGTTGTYRGMYDSHEFIIYDSDQSSNRTGIEDNINTFYGIYDAGLIGEYSGAAAAYSLRSLSSVYDGAAITVRRDSDDSTKNIYFDSDGNLDTAALTGFCGNNNGYAIRWFDQSGNANHGIQTAEAAQPKVYDSVTGIYYENGTPSLRFERVSNSVGDTLFTPAQQWIGAGDNASSVIVTNKYQTPYGSSSLFSSNGGGTNKSFNWAATSSPAKIVFVALGSTNASSPNFSFSNLNIRAAYMSSATVEGYESGVDLGSGTAGSGLYNPSIEIYMGARHGAGEGHYFGMFKEFILWDSYLGADKVDIDQKINQHYLIYQPDTAPTSGLLASYPGVHSAYSLRQLSNEAMIAVTVRRDSDDNVSPIGFDGRGLDTEALAAWCGNSNGYVTTWWDQSLNQINGTQGSLTLQPKIYDASTGVVTKNGKPAIEFDGVNDNIRLNYPGGSNTAHFVIVGAPTVTSFVNYVRDYAGNNFRLRLTTPAGGGFSADNRTPGGTVSSGLTLPEFSQFVQTALITPTTVATHLNGVGNSASFTNTVSLRNNGDIPRDGNKYTAMLLQEFMVYPSDQTSNRTGIENDIFSFYTGYLLDQYSGAAAAYSLRALSSTATNAVEVRRDSDDATQYIGFVQDGFSLSLDTSALSTFCGSANGYVTEWVDQSGNGNHAAQAAFTAQPKIYDSTTGVVTENGKPAVQFDGSNDGYLLDTTGLDIGSLSSFTVGTFATTANQNMMLALSGNVNNKRWYAPYFTNGNFNFGYASSGVAINTTGDTNQNLFTLISGTTLNGVEAFLRGSSIGTTTRTTGIDTTKTGLGNWNNSLYANCNVQEVIVYGSDQSTNRTNIEDNINGYYDIY